MEAEATRGQNLMANAAVLKSRTALAEMALTQDATIKLQ